jgi:hypothetical protein
MEPQIPAVVEAQVLRVMVEQPTEVTSEQMVEMVALELL